MLRLHRYLPFPWPPSVDFEAGSVSNAHKGLHNGVSVATFALGDDRLYRWLDDNPAFAMLPD